jgi:hypothetical protein
MVAPAYGDPAWDFNVMDGELHIDPDANLIMNTGVAYDRCVFFWNEGGTKYLRAYNFDPVTGAVTVGAGFPRALATVLIRMQMISASRFVVMWQSTAGANLDLQVELYNIASDLTITLVDLLWLR